MKLKIILYALFLTILTSPLLSGDFISETKKAIAHSLDAVLGDTINEGEGHVEVKTKSNGEPAMDCVIRNSKSTPDKKWFFCKIYFNVIPYEDAEEETRSCNISYFILKNDPKSLDIKDQTEETACLERLAESD